MNVAIYARVSTADQDVQRQLDECHEHIERKYPEADEIEEFPEIVSGATTDARSEYDRLWDAIAEDEFDAVIVHEISRLSRLGATEIHEFIQHALEHGTGVESLDVGLSIRVDDPSLQQTVYTMIANIMGDLAKIEHEQKLQRINSGIKAAQQAGKWTARAPRGFYVGEDKRLHVDPEGFLTVRHALERVANGTSKRQVADDSGIPRSTLTDLYNDEERRQMYLQGEHEDERVDAAINVLRPLPDVEIGEAEDLDQHIRTIVQEELSVQE